MSANDTSYLVGAVMLVAVAAGVILGLFGGWAEINKHWPKSVGHGPSRSFPAPAVRPYVTPPGAVSKRISPAERPASKPAPTASRKQVLMLPLREDGPYPYRLLVKTGTGYIGYRVDAAIYARARLFAEYDPVLTIVRIDDAYDFTNDQDKLPTVLKETGGHAVLIQYTETLLKPEADPTDKTSDWQDF